MFGAQKHCAAQVGQAPVRTVQYVEETLTTFCWCELGLLTEIIQKGRFNLSA